MTGEFCLTGHRVGADNRCVRCGVIPNCCWCGHAVKSDIDICECCMDWLCEKCTVHVAESECDFCPACAENELNQVVE